jgi:hypothetical protein
MQFQGSTPCSLYAVFTLFALLPAAEDNSFVAIGPKNHSQVLQSCMQSNEKNETCMYENHG